MKAKTILGLVMVLLMSTSVFAFSGNGLGTELAPYEIETCGQLSEMRDEVTAHYILTQDLSCGSFTSVGGLVFISGSPTLVRFSGSLDGQGHSISGLSITPSNSVNGGLIGILDAGGVVENIELIGATATGQDQIGLLVGWNWAGAVINNTKVSGTVIATGNRAGGLVGENDGEIIASSASADVSSFIWGGGLVGRNNVGSIEDSYATGSVTVTISNAGGLAGSNGANPITNSYATGSVSANSHAGGLVGSPGGTITNSFSTGAITCVQPQFCGGFYGNGGPTLTNPYWYDAPDAISVCYTGPDRGPCVDQPIDYFQGDVHPANVPMDAWDFTNIWQEVIGPDSFPIHQPYVGACGTLYYLDADGDYVGDDSDVITSCTAVPGRVLQGGDCNDADASIYPLAEEVCDFIDNNCDGKIDTEEGTSCPPKGALIPTLSTYDSMSDYFYTTSLNPQTVSLNGGESVILTFNVVAPGPANSSHVFYAYAEDAGQVISRSENTIINITQ